MELVHEFTVQVSIGEGVPIGGGPFGTRSVGTVADGSVRGERINGRVVGPSADWALFGTDGYAEIDVRLQVRTDDGASLYVRYTGSLQATGEMMTALRGPGTTEYGDTYWCTHLRIETGAEQYAWVNRTLFVGEGRVVPDGVEYAVYRLG